jgi:NAD(P)-dependent dehydrogenase (short-subunit alcohol dehydrogenase family)
MTSVLLTGASTGIGRATALRLDSSGWRVFAGVRRDADAEALRDAASDRLTPLLLDVTDSGQIEAAARQVESELGDAGLDGLLNNAGIGIPSPLEMVPVEDLRRQLEVNLVGQVAVTQAFLPLIREAPGTVVFIASIGGRIASPFMSPYNTSKFAIEALGESLRQELAPWDINVVVIEPGSIDTPIWEKGAQTIDEQMAKLTPAAKRLYSKQLRRMDEVLRETASRGIAPEKVASTIHTAIRSEKPKHRYLVGRDAKIAARLKGTLPDRTFTKLISRQVKMPTDVPAK